jgi:hypothetical protein
MNKTQAAEFLTQIPLTSNSANKKRSNDDKQSPSAPVQLRGSTANFPLQKKLNLVETKTTSNTSSNNNINKSSEGVSASQIYQKLPSNATRLQQHHHAPLRRFVENTSSVHIFYFTCSHNTLVDSLPVLVVREL